MTGTFQVAHVAAYFSMTASTPGFWRPIEFSMPPGVSVTRGVGLPIRALSVVPLQQIPPRRSTSTTSPYSTPYPNVPDATRIGFGRTSPRPRSTDRSTESAATGAAATGRPFDGTETTTDAPRPIGVAGRLAGVGYFCSATRGDEVTARRFAFIGRQSCGDRIRSRPRTVPGDLLGREDRSLATDTLRDAGRAHHHAA